MRVLVVEDNETMADAVQRGLIAEGFDVDVATNGTDGLWRAREFSYDVMVLDLMLPGVNGYEITRTIRSEGVATPILMLSAKDGEYDIAEGLEWGADDFLTKPFSFVVLVARVNALLRRTNPSPIDDTITVGTMRIEPTTRRCFVDGEELDLTQREFTLLETLARRPGTPLTRTELLDHVWGADLDVGSNVVDVYIGYLRRKLTRFVSAAPEQFASEQVAPELDALPALHGNGQPELLTLGRGGAKIETVRGVGYRIVAAPC